MNTNQDARTQAQKGLFKKVTTELLRETEEPLPNDGNGREITGIQKK